MKRKQVVKTLLVGMFLVMVACAFAPVAFAQGEDHAEDADTGGSGGLTGLGLGIGAGLAVGLAGIGTGLAQSGVGAGGTGALAEKPEMFGTVLILFAIPETIVLFGFVLGFLLLGQIG